MDNEFLTNAVAISFDKWGSNHPKMKPLYAKMTDGLRKVALASFREMPALAPSGWEVWWAKEHNRFIGSNRQSELIVLHELMYHFLTAFVRGELRYESDKGKKRTGRRSETAAEVR